MATAFRAGGVGVEARLEPEERSLLLALVEDLASLLEPAAIADPLGLGLLDGAGRSADPVLARLLPDAYPHDDAAAAEFRRLTEHGLRSRKSQALTAMADDLHAASDDIRLDPAQARAWLSGLNDLRLALGTRMGLGVEALSPPAALTALYDWLTWMQDALIAAIDDVADTLAP